MNWSLIRFEFKKIFLSKKTGIVFLLLLCALLAMVAINVRKDRTYWFGGGDIGTEEMLVQNSYYLIKGEYSATGNTTEEDIEARERLEKHFKFYRAQYLYIYQLRLVGKKVIEAPPNEILRLYIEKDRDLLAGIEDDGYDYFGQTPALVRQRLAANEYMWDNDIEPLNSPYEMKGMNFLSQLFNYPWFLLFFAAVALLNVDMFSKETDGGAFKILYSQPWGRRKVFWAKIISHFLVTMAITLASVLFVFLLVTFTNGFGASSYPMFYYSQSFRSLSPSLINESASIFIPWLSYFPRGLLVFFTAVTTTTVLIGVFSSLLGNTSNALGFSFILLFFNVLFRTIFPTTSLFYSFWPFSALEVNQVLTGAYTLTAMGYLLQLFLLAIGFCMLGAHTLHKRNFHGDAAL